MFIQQLKEAFTVVTKPRTKLALVVRADLKMSRGKTAAQCAHAAVLCFQKSQINMLKCKLVYSWTHKGQPKIVLRVNTYEEIISLKRRAEQVGIVAATVRDAGLTQLEPGTVTVLGLGPDKSDRIDKLVGDLKLL